VSTVENDEGMDQKEKVLVSEDEYIRSRWLSRCLSPSVVGSMAFVLAAVLVLISGSQYLLYEATMVAIYSIVTVSQEWLLGRAGLLSLGPAALMLIGAFTTARMSTLSWGIFPIPMLVSMFFGAVVGLLIGIPSLRLRGLYLMLSTLALQFVVAFVAEEYQGVNNEAGFFVNLPHWGSLQLTSPRPFFIVCMVVLGISLVLLAGLYRGVPGRAWNALRQSEAAASVLGVNVARWKLFAFIGSSAMCAVAGSLYAYQTEQVNYLAFTLDLAIVIVVMVFVGGIGTMTGPIIGAVLVVFLPYWFQQLSGHLGGIPSLATWLSTNGAEVSTAIYGLLLLLVLVFEPGGIFRIGKRLGNLFFSGARFLFRLVMRTERSS
jgi:branched-chain amino acid transport system permease protein